MMRATPMVLISALAISSESLTVRTMTRWMFRLTALLVLSMGLCCRIAYAEQYLSLDDFLQQCFGEQVAPEAKMLWLTAELSEQLKEVRGQRLAQIRMRYWSLGSKTAWVINEIGKEKPITIGILVDEQHISRLDILAFRESRGWEVKHPFFTQQFNGASLNKKKNLDRRIDGITGATLSVRAVSKAAEMALLMAASLEVVGQ